MNFASLNHFQKTGNVEAFLTQDDSSLRGWSAGPGRDWLLTRKQHAEVALEETDERAELSASKELKTKELGIDLHGNWTLDLPEMI
jgi:hypothetical protein